MRYFLFQNRLKRDSAHLSHPAEFQRARNLFHHEQQKTTRYQY